MGKQNESQGAAPKGAGGGFTPGPWTHNAPFFADVVGPDGKDLAVVISADMGTLTIPAGAPTVGPRTRAHAFANARLIAAAPELLEALREARRWIGDGDMSDGMDRSIWTPEYAAVVDQVDAALAKAGGES